ncbi:hypothetical protein [Shewanella salipaludis]|uniref:Uncharacterized protein n=1 Tax=Shewanella salipaludis TaxID=2723052 RepID=A0A972FUS8_9GAMM|nr:hypothetical protein [Shewanella salipaludis]NMH65704.1 hypothetical protein [Shewanella salipaludis]
MSNTKFLIIYLIVMVLTYFWRFAFVGAAFGDGADIEGMGNAMNTIMFLSYAVMAYVAYSRGKTIGKGYLVAFPIVGAVFDLILIFIPFVPTIMNIITIVLGMPDSKPAEVPHQEEHNT